MPNNPTARVAFLKRELGALIQILEKEKERYDAIDYSKLDDDEAGNVGDDHEVIDGILSMLKASFEDTFK